MHSRRLHTSLHEYADQAAAALSAQVAAGSEVGFEVIQQGGRGSAPPLYCYQPLTGEFLAHHGAELRGLPAHGAAIHALAALDNLGAYADSSAGDPRELAEAALTRFIGRVFTEGDFTLTPERFEPAYREAEGVLVDGRSESALLCLLRGITVESADVPLGDGVIVAPPECLEQLPPDPLWLGADGESLVIAIAAGTAGIARAIGRARELQRAMSLFAPGIACAPIGWLRGESGVWRAVALGVGARAVAGEALVIAPEQEDELRAFCNLIVSRTPAEGELAWALERFELGLDREDELAGLTDHLLALRALLEPEGPPSGRLAGRLAALCAMPDEQAELAVRVARTISLETAVVSGSLDVGADASALALGLESHLRALLRDMVCGHLPRDVVSLADGLLLEPPPAHEQDLPGDDDGDGETDAFDLFDEELAHGEVPALPLVQLG